MGRGGQGGPIGDEATTGEDQGILRRPGWWFAALVVVGIYIAVLLVVGGRDAADAISDADPVPLLGALVLAVAITLIWPLVHRSSLRAVGENLGYGKMLQVSMSTFTVSHSVPGGGAVGAAAAIERLTRFGVPGAAATASVTVTGLVSLTTICALGAVGIAAAVLADELPGIALAAALVVFAVLVGIAFGVVVGLRSPAAGEWVLTTIGRIHGRLRRRADGWREHWHDVVARAPAAGGLVRIVGWAAIKWTADVAMLALVFVALGETPRLTVLLVGFGVSQILAVIPATPGAVGFVEGGMVGAFAAFGMSVTDAAVVVLTYRVLETWLPTLAGLPVLLRPRRSG